MQQSGKRVETEHEKSRNERHFCVFWQPAHLCAHVRLPQTYRSLHDQRLAHFAHGDFFSASSAGLATRLRIISRLTEDSLIPNAVAMAAALAFAASIFAKVQRLEALNCLPLFFPI